MPITYSLQNLLLDDPELHHMFDTDDGLLGPIVRMRWISNLVRLAVLEELDQLHAAAGEYTEHASEIRRLRRSSMAPDAGRYYPVDGKANRVFKQLLPEQARQIVDHWRTRQTLGDRNYDQSISPSQLASPAHPACPELAEGEPVERERKHREFFERFGADEQYSQSEYQNEYEDDSEESDELFDEEYAEEYAENGIDDDDDEFAHDPQQPARDGHKSFPISMGNKPRTPPALRPLTAVPAVSEAEPSEVRRPVLSEVEGKHQEQRTKNEERAFKRNTKHELRASRVTRFAGAAAVAAVMLLAALLGLSATWFLKAHFETTNRQPTPPHSVPVGILSSTKIVPSAVPRNPVSTGADPVVVSPNTKPQTPNPNERWR